MFGRRLIAAREQRGLSLDDAAHETRIPAARLRWLEQGNIAAFGSITYARSFVRAYSAFLGVNAADYLAALPERGALGGRRDYRYLTESQGEWLREREYSLYSRLRAAPDRPVMIRQISSPIPAGVRAFAVMLAATAFWGMHLAEVHADVQAHAKPQPTPPLKVSPKPFEYVHATEGQPRTRGPLHISVADSDLTID